MSSGAVVFIRGGCVHRCSKLEMFFLVKRCATVEDKVILIVLVARRIWLKRAIFLGKTIVPENNTLLKLW